MEGCEATINADIGRRLIYAESKVGNLDHGVGKREEVSYG